MTEQKLEQLSLSDIQLADKTNSISQNSLAEEPEILTTQIMPSPPNRRMSELSDASVSEQGPTTVEFLPPNAPSVKTHMYLEKIAELRASEAFYIIGLENLKNLYFPKLLASSELNANIKSRLNLINLSNIISFHKLMLKDLYKNEIVDTFVKYSEYLSTYENYIVYYPEISEELRLLKKTSNSFARLTVIQSGGVMDLFSYLIMPVQRLPRYELILKDLQKLVQNEGEISDIQLAMRNVKRVTEYINQAKRKYEQLSKVQYIAGLLKSDDHIKMPRIFHQSQKLISENELKCFVAAKKGSFISRISSAITLTKTPKKSSSKSISTFHSKSRLSESSSTFESQMRLSEFINSLHKRTYRFFLFSDILMWTKAGSYKLKGYVMFKYGKCVAGIHDGFLSEEQLDNIKMESKQKRKSDRFRVDSDEEDVTIKLPTERKNSTSEASNSNGSNYVKSGKKIWVLTICPPIFNNDRISTEDFVCLYFNEELDKENFKNEITGVLKEIESVAEKGLKKQIDVVARPKFETTRLHGSEFEYRKLDEIEEEIHATKRWQ
eukprot:GAHX01001085.1.p1 GENE.GAHX01001085.1~~GAHX01001085.1.p1  ORF type:complete len:551 (-),score=119.40 GAHX01001085.1:32-1684(-)